LTFTKYQVISASDAAWCSQAIPEAVLLTWGYRKKPEATAFSNISLPQFQLRTMSSYLCRMLVLFCFPPFSYCPNTPNYVKDCHINYISLFFIVRWFAWSNVPGTNMILLVTDATCDCHLHHLISTEYPTTPYILSSPINNKSCNY